MSIDWYHGNAAEDGQQTRGWLLGHFIDPVAGACGRARMSWLSGGPGSQAGYLLVEVGDHGGGWAVGGGEDRADSAQLGERLFGVAGGGGHLGDQEAGLRDLQRLLRVSRRWRGSVQDLAAQRA